MRIRTTFSARTLAATMTLAGAYLLAPPLAGCGDDSTAGKRVTLKTRVTSAGEAQASFTNAMGWAITLKKAALSVGPLYYFDGDPLFARRAPRGPRLRLGLPTALAHPGHYVAGDAMGQMLEASSVDLVAGDADFPPGAGVSGAYRSGRVTFASPPRGPAAGALFGHVVVLEGEASKGDLRRAFRAELDAADLLNGKGEPLVDGCTFQETKVDGPGVVSLVVRPRVWLDQLDLGPLAEGAAPALLPRDSVAWNALTRGVKSATAYAFAFAP